MAPKTRAILAAIRVLKVEAHVRAVEPEYRDLVFDPHHDRFYFIDEDCMSSTPSDDDLDRLAPLLAKDALQVVDKRRASLCAALETP